MVIQAVLGHPLTVYGTGGQIRGLINLVDTVECIRISAENPAERRASSGCSTSSPSRCRCARSPRPSSVAYPGPCTVEQIDNPRVESEDHYYRAAHTRLLDLGLVPHLLNETLIDSMFAVVERNKSRVQANAIRPTVRWRDTSSDLAWKR